MITYWLTEEAMMEGHPAPFRKHITDAGWDLTLLRPAKTYADDVRGKFILVKGVPRLFHTGVGFNIPPGWYGQIVDRSSLAIQGVIVSGGVIDSGYQGEVKVILTALTYDSMVMQRDRIAQIVFKPCYSGDMELVERPMSPSERGDKGFGSTNL